MHSMQSEGQETSSGSLLQVSFVSVGISEASKDIERLKVSETLLNPSDATYIIHGNFQASSSAELSRFSVPKYNIIRVLGADEYAAAGLTDAANMLTFKRPPPLLYDPNRIRKDLGLDKRYVIVRWDRFVFASCKDSDELLAAAAKLEACIQGSVIRE